MSLRIVPTDLDEANAFIRAHHRHHKPARGCKFVLAVADGERIVGVAIAGRPNARELQDGYTLDVTRTCTDGTPHAPSMLYGAAWRAARALGYLRMGTYTLPSEGGASLRAAGWKLVNERAGGGTWSRRSRPRVDKHPTQVKLRWEVAA